MANVAAGTMSRQIFWPSCIFFKLECMPRRIVVFVFTSCHNEISALPCFDLDICRRVGYREDLEACNKEEIHRCSTQTRFSNIFPLRNSMFAKAMWKNEEIGLHGTRDIPLFHRFHATHFPLGKGRISRAATQSRVYIFCRARVPLS